MENVNIFVDFLQKNFDLTQEHYAKPYSSMSVCVIEAIYSLQAKYFGHTIPVVERYADKYMHGNRYNPGDNIKELLMHIEEEGGPELFVDNVIKNHQK
jgi:hypothetical protein